MVNGLSKQTGKHFTAYRAGEIYPCEPDAERSSFAAEIAQMRQVPGHSLWLGNAADLRDASVVMASGVEAVVELADSESHAILPRELVRCRFPLSDGGDNPAWLLRLAAETVAALLRAGVPVLICCSAGMSRSLCVAAGGIALAEGRSLAEAMSAITASGPADVSPGLLMQLQQVLGQ